MEGLGRGSYHLGSKSMVCSVWSSHPWLPQTVCRRAGPKKEAYSLAKKAVKGSGFRV